MQVLKITIANDIKEYFNEGSETNMFVPIENVTAVFHAPNSLPVVVVGDKQYAGFIEVIETNLSKIIVSETLGHQDNELTKVGLAIDAEVEAND